MGFHVILNVWMPINGYNLQNTQNAQWAEIEYIW